MKQYSTLGVIAHVDAGKTTLCEALLWRSGRIRTPGRVDHRDTFFDTDRMERERGITIFSKQAVLPLPDLTVNLLDTPGHADFSAETESALSVMDCCALVISGTDGIQAHTETLWKLLEQSGLPCFLFITKMDIPTADRAALMQELRVTFGDECVDFSPDNADRDEQLAMCSEAAMDAFLETGSVPDAEIAAQIASRRLFPCFFGSGLKAEGVDEFLQAVIRYAPRTEPLPAFGARVFKIDTDSRGVRQTHMKLTGGTLQVREPVSYRDKAGKAYEEKISAVRCYAGARFDAVEQAEAGMLCTVTGLTESYIGMGLGTEQASGTHALRPVMTYDLILPEGCDPALLLPRLRSLSEENAELPVAYDERTGLISVRLMGRIQAEIFCRMVSDRFDTDIRLGPGRVLYYETIRSTVEGVGHFEPLRHYAEVHLLMSPGEPGSGITIRSSCPEDLLDRNWQRLIMTHIAERTHPGVLTGAPLTDVVITLAAGRAHLKHTEGGDFRQAVYRAIRQGLMQADNVLLEPFYDFTLTVPQEAVGRAITDIRAMGGDFESPERLGSFSRIHGHAPVAELNAYADTVPAYTHGRGRLSCRPGPYLPCHNAEEVIAAAGYHAEEDAENPADSVFCAHGSGFIVKWNQVPEYMHLESCLPKDGPAVRTAPVVRSTSIDDRELEAIMEKEFGPIRRREYSAAFRNEAAAKLPSAPVKKPYVIVDGYNVIFADPELSALAAKKLDMARAELMQRLSAYSGFTGSELVLVFDGFRTPGNPGSREEYHNIHVVYTADGETGDAYIERLAEEIGPNYAVRVVTNDNLIRVSVMRSGLLRESSDIFLLELADKLAEMRRLLASTNTSAHKVKLSEEVKEGSRHE